MLMQTLDDAAVIALLPGLVLALRRSGLPARLETAALALGGMAMVCLADLAAGATAVTTATAAGWVLTGLIDGLAAAGLTKLAPPRRGPAGARSAGARSATGAAVRRIRTLR